MAAQIKSKKKIWFIVVDGETEGPFNQSSIKMMLESNAFSVDQLIWKEGMKDWLPLKSVKDFRKIAKKHVSDAEKRFLDVDSHIDLKPLKIDGPVVMIQEKGNVNQGMRGPGKLILSDGIFSIKAELPQNDIKLGALARLTKIQFRDEGKHLADLYFQDSPAFTIRDHEGAGGLASFISEVEQGLGKNLQLNYNATNAANVDLKALLGKKKGKFGRFFKYMFYLAIYAGLIAGICFLYYYIYMQE